MTVAVRLRVSKTESGQMSEGLGHNETDYNSLKIKYRITCKLLLNLSVYY